MRLRRAPDELPVDLAEGLGDLDLAAQQVEPLDLEAGDLPGPQPRVRADQHQQPVAGIDRLGEPLDLDGVQEVHLELGPAGESAHVGGDVDGQSLLLPSRRVQQDSKAVVAAALHDEVDKAARTCQRVPVFTAAFVARARLGRPGPGAPAAAAA
jgi:hypothetical protein